MTSESIDWDEDLPADEEEEYQTFIRTLERTEGFRLLFVRCTPAEGKQLITRVKDELPQKTIEVLPLDKPIENLYEIVEQLPNREQINILFIQGLEHSFYEYELTKFGDASERYSYSWQGVPRILNHLNQHRERFRDNFKICFVFLLRPFSLKYFIHRAPDFFDWRSSVFEFPTKPEILERESSRILRENDYEKYLTLNPEKRIKKVLEIQEILEEDHPTSSSRASLLFELGNLLFAAKEYEAAIASYDQASKINPKFLQEAWYNRSIALVNLGRLEEAIASANQQKFSTNSGVEEGESGRKGEGEFLTSELFLSHSTSYDQTLKIKPQEHQAWFNWGTRLAELGRIEEAIASYNQALKFKPDFPEAWNDRGVALFDLGRIEEAMANYNQALKFKPNFPEAWFNRGNALLDLGRFEEAIDSYEQAIQFRSDFPEAWFNRGVALKNLGKLEAAIVSYEQALQFQVDFPDAGFNRAHALGKLGRLEAAIASYEQVLAINPEDCEARYNKACCHALQSQVDLAIENLQKAINLNPDECREMAKTDSDFDSIREDERFQALIQEPLPGN